MQRASETSLRVRAVDGFALGATVFRGDGLGAQRGLVIVNGATAVKRGYYARFAMYLARAGFDVITYDYRGVGESRPASLRGFHATMREWGTLDQAGVLAWAAREYGGAGVSIVGHSVGGQILGYAPDLSLVRRVLLVGAQHGHWRHWPVTTGALLAGFWYVVVPVTTRMLPYFPSNWFGLGDPLPRGVAIEWAQWCRGADGLAGGSEDPRRAGFRRLHAPMRSLSVSDDAIAPPRAVEALLTFYENAPREHFALTPRDAGQKSFGHFGYFKERVGGALWVEAVEWLGRG